MKTLHLMRHAKSSWKYPELSDRYRGLNKRGQRDAPRMGQALESRMAALSIHVSPAKRAQLTLAGLRHGWRALDEASHCTEEALYTFSDQSLSDWIQGRSDAKKELFIIAHNPALTDLVNQLTGQLTLDNLPTAGYVQLSLEIESWRDLRPGCGVLEYSLFPRQLRGL